MDTDIVDVTNFNSSGARENIAGLLSGTITFSGPLDQAVMNTVSGTSYAFVLNAGTSSFTATARISSVKVTTAVDGTAQASGEAKTTGTFTAALA